MFQENFQILWQNNDDKMQGHITVDTMTLVTYVINY